jgi:hypothetical protein
MPDTIGAGEAHAHTAFRVPIRAVHIPVLFLLGAALSCTAAPDGGAGGAVARVEKEATFPEAFAYLGAVRELPGGVVLVADPVGEVLVRADFGTGRADTLGGVGSGPQEYRSPDRVFALPGGASLLVDLGNGRLTVVSATGEFLDWVRMAQGTPEGRMLSLMPEFVDDAGKIYARSIQRGFSAPPDSTPIARYSGEGQEEAVVAWAWHPDYMALMSSGKRPMLRPTDVWAVDASGRVAVVRANSLSVDWYGPGGAVSVGAPQALETYPLGDAEKTAEVARMMEEAIVTETQVGDGVETARMRRGVPPGAAPGMDEFSWPDRLPAFRSARVSPDGDVWAERYMPAGRLPRYEVFDASGTYRGYVELPMGSRLVGFGSGAEGAALAYIARTDETGLKWLERYRIVAVD